MTSYVLLLFIMLLLWQTCLSTHECNRTILGKNMTFTCPVAVGNQLLRLYDLTSEELENITLFIAEGMDGTTSGPFTSIPPNLCLMPNLQTIIFSNNLIVSVDPTDSLSKCFSNVITLDVSTNRITNFPSYLIYNMPNLKNLYFQHNNLTEVPANAFSNVSLLEIVDFSYNQLTTFELWALDVKTKADFSHNKITTITNKYFYTSDVNQTTPPTVFLTGNGPTINFTDAIYEMYDQCEEVQQWYFTDDVIVAPPLFTGKLRYINFGTTQIDCSCNQIYFLKVFIASYTTEYPYPILDTMCSNSSQNSSNVKVFNSSCIDSTFDKNSTLDFTQVYPRYCKIQSNEAGSLTQTIEFPAPSSSASTYPHYETVDMNFGTCFFTFTNATTMNIACTNDTSNTLSQIPATLLGGTYMSNITHVTFSSNISILPTYLCSLPSREIDISYQTFTTLSDTTFPCLDSFRKVSLSRNQISSVNIVNGNFQNLTSLDLSANQLTSIPYSVLMPTPTSLRSLDLRNNSINYIDLFVYTRKNINIYLDNNPINSTNILNPQNTTLIFTTNSTANVTFPASVTSSTIIIDDSIAITYGVCNDFQSLRNMLLSLESTDAEVQLDCSCKSVNLKQIYLNNNQNILVDFSCSNPSQAETFFSVSMATCPTYANFSSGLCTNETSATITTMQTVNPTTFTSVYTATLMMNSTTISTTATATTSNTTLAGSGNITTTTATTVAGSGNTTTTTATTVAASSNTTTTTATTVAASSNTTTTTTVAASSNTTTTTATTVAGSSNTTTTTATTVAGSSNTTTTTATTVAGSGNTTTTTATTVAASSNTTTTTATTVAGSSNTTTTTATTVAGSSNTTTTTATTVAGSSNTTTTTATTVAGSGNTTTTTTTQSPFGTTVIGGATTTTATIVTTTTTTISTSQSNSSSSGGTGNVQSSNNSDSNRTGLIVGLVVGIGGFLLLLAAIIAAIILLKRCKGGGGAGDKRRVSRISAKGSAAPDGQKAPVTPSTRLQSRNPRGIQLAASPSTSSQLPSRPVEIMVPNIHNDPNLRKSTRGIPLRLDPIRPTSGANPLSPPVTTTLSNPTTLRSTNSLPMNPPSLSQPPPHQVLNIGGDVRF